MGDWRTEHPVENGSFPDDSVDWMDTPEGQQSIEALDLVFGALDYVDVDAFYHQLCPACAGINHAHRDARTQRHCLHRASSISPRVKFGLS